MLGAQEGEAYGMTADWYTVGVALRIHERRAPLHAPRHAEAGSGRGPSTARSARGSARVLEQRWQDRIGRGPEGSDEIKKHKYFDGVDWDIVSACKPPSPLKGVKGVPKRKKDKEQAQRTAHNMLESDQKEQAQEGTVHMDYVSPVAVQEEYLESMYRCVSSI